MILERMFQRAIDISDPESVARALEGRYGTASGAVVNERTAMAQATVYSCVRILSESIAMLPIRLMKYENGRTDEVENHNALDVLYSPNNWMTPHEFMQLWVSCVELRGNFNSYKNRNGRQEVRELLPLLPQQVTVRQESDWRLVYTVSGERASGEYSQEQILHARGLSSDGYQGMSTLAVHRESIGLALQTEKHGATLFKNGAQLGVIFKHPKTLSDEGHARLLADLNAKYAGAGNAHKSILLEEDMGVEKVTMTSQDSQFLETRRFQKQEIAGIYGIPMFLLNDTEKSTTWGSGLEQISKAFVTYTLKPRLSRITQTLARELLSRSERKNHFFTFDTDEFNLASLKERFEAYGKGIESGVINPNEARDKENMNPRTGGEVYRLPANIGQEGAGNEDETP